MKQDQAPNTRKPDAKEKENLQRVASDRNTQQGYQRSDLQRRDYEKR